MPPECTEPQDTQSVTYSQLQHTERNIAYINLMPMGYLFRRESSVIVLAIKI